MSGKKKVLLIEHDPDLSDLYQHALVEAGFTVKVARTAQESVIALDDWPAHAVLLDLGLPDNSGIEVLHELQSYDDWGGLPVVALTNVRPEHYPMSPEAWADYGVKRVLYRPQVRPRKLAALLKTLAKDS